jgi:hypothetical protein
VSMSFLGKLFPWSKSGKGPVPVPIRMIFQWIRQLYTVCRGRLLSRNLLRTLVLDSPLRQKDRVSSPRRSP